jgi:hypothetical protein
MKTVIKHMLLRVGVDITTRDFRTSARGFQYLTVSVGRCTFQSMTATPARRVFTLRAVIHAIHHSNIHCASRALPCSYTSGKLVQSMEPATMSITVVRDLTPCGVVHRNQHFLGTCCLRLRGRKVRVLSCTA